MKLTAFLFLIAFIPSNTFCQKVELPTKVTELKNGIVVKHSKKKVYAEINEDYPTRGGKYKWKYETTIKAKKENLEIIEFGAFGIENSKWVEGNIDQKPFNTDEFSQWYSCPNGLAIKKTKYTDSNNWTSGDELTNMKSKTLWYYIGVNSNNEKFVGHATIEIISNLSK